VYNTRPAGEKERREKHEQAKRMQRLARIPQVGSLPRASLHIFLVVSTPKRRRFGGRVKKKRKCFFTGLGRCCGNWSGF